MRLIGIDIGGTFTDLMLADSDGLHVHKLLSTPENPALALLTGITTIALHGDTSDDLRIMHGSTVATNAILERKGSRTALITTQGFRDILAIGRQARPELYALHPTLPPPIIPRSLCFEVPERLDHTGEVITPLDLDALDDLLDDLIAEEIESVAVCLLYSYANPAHEIAIRDRMLERSLFTSDQIALSHEVLPEFREYERASTVALDAYVRPVMNRYLTQIEAELPTVIRRGRANTPPLLVMRSDGGVARATHVRRQAIQTALSGPAAGVIGAFHLARLAGFDHIITLDIGGTSTDVALCPGAPIRRTETTIDGLPLRIPIIDIETVGAGGGSIARVDAGGALRVGPQSAGANPGPIIYGRGGTTITTSDAHAILGRLDPDYFLGGTMALDLAPAEAMMDALGIALDLDRVEAAQGIIDIANVLIDRAMRRVSVERGFDPRDFTLVAFGGAGPLHACEVAEGLAIATVVIPRYPGVLCAFGLLMADVIRSASQSYLRLATEETLVELTPMLDEMRNTARDELLAEGVVEDAITYEPLVDLRYRGQAYELTVPFSADAIQDFHAAHQRRYGYHLPERAVECVTVRLRALGRLPQPEMRPETSVASDGSEALLGKKRIAAVPEQATRLYDREKLHPGARFAGPALIVQFDTTSWVPAGWQGIVDGYRNLCLTKEAH